MYVSRFKLRFMTLLLSCMLVLPAAAAQTNTDEAAQDLLREIQLKTGIFTLSGFNKALGKTTSSTFSAVNTVSSIKSILEEDNEIQRSLLMMQFILGSTPLGNAYAGHIALAKDLHDEIVRIGDDVGDWHWDATGQEPYFIIEFKRGRSRIWGGRRPSSRAIAASLAHASLVIQDTSGTVQAEVFDDCVSQTNADFNKTCRRTGSVAANSIDNHAIILSFGDFPVGEYGGGGYRFTLLLCWDETANTSSEVLETEQGRCPEGSVRTVIPMKSDFTLNDNRFNIRIQFQSRAHRDRLILDDEFELLRPKLRF